VAAVHPTVLEFKTEIEQVVQKTYAPDELMVYASVHPTASRKLTIRFWLRSLQHWMNRRCVGASIK
jgi:hypothetical protein